MQDINLEIADGEYFMILGPTGAGKTILLETIAGIYKPDHGTIILNGRDVTHVPPKDRNVGIVYQDYVLFPFLTVEENIGFGLRAQKFDKKIIADRVHKMAESLNVSHLLHRYPKTLSGGEKQRIAMARALIMEPNVLMLDEPLGALDVQTAERIIRELKEIHAITHTTTIHITHNHKEAFFLGDRMAIMNKGNIIQIGKPNEVFSKPNSKFVADFVGSINLFRGKSTIDEDIAHIEVDGIEITSTTLKSGEVYVSVRPEDILLSTQKIRSSARNSFKGKIVDILDEGKTFRIAVDVGINAPVVVAITKRAFYDMNLKMGLDVYINFKALAVHVF